MAQENIILIVDDIKSNLALLDTILSAEGYTLVSATNGEDAIKKTNEIEFDLIILDIMMPKKDGFAVFEELKANRKTALVPVVFITVINNDIDTLRAFEMGAVDYITKPFTPTELRTRIRTQIALVNSRKRKPENKVLGSDAIPSIEQNSIENLKSTLEQIKKQILHLKKTHYSAEEKANLDQLKARTYEILSLIQSLTS